jgi:hypothetical protein
MLDAGDRPRARTLEGREVELATRRGLAGDELLGELVMEPR